MDYQADFKALNNGYTYLNSASTTYKPQVVIDEIKNYYENYSTNIGRGVDELGYTVTKMYENSRETIANFMGVNSNEIIFTRGTTASLNLVAYSLGDLIVNEGDEIVVSVTEHHANFIPWQQLCERKKAKLILSPTLANGTVSPEGLNSVMSSKTKIVALNHTSNVLGATNNISELGSIAHKYNAYFIVDGAQGITHEKLDLDNVDFYAFSAHKLYGPTGVGVLYGKYEILKKMKPLEFGGEMINTVSIEKTTFKEPPHSFEAGTMMIAEVLGFKKAVEYVQNIGIDKINAHIKTLRDYTLAKLKEKYLEDIIIYNEDVNNGNLITFNFRNIHAHDVASVLNENKIIVRARPSLCWAFNESFGSTCNTPSEFCHL